MGVCFRQTIGEENHFLAAGHLWQGNISGGPYTLTEVRLAKGYTNSINKYIQYIYIHHRTSKLDLWHVPDQG